jgi:hypothetical protein
MTFRPYPKSESTMSAKTYREKYLSKERKKNKYNASSTTYNGLKYDSKLEANYAEELDYRVKAGEIIKWERQVKLDLQINGFHITNYFIDFKEYHADGTIMYTEVKGLKMQPWIMKWRMLNALREEILEPGAELQIVK